MLSKEKEVSKDDVSFLVILLYKDTLHPREES